MLAPFARDGESGPAGLAVSIVISSGITAAATVAILIALWRAKPRTGLLVLAQAYSVAVLGAMAVLLVPSVHTAAAGTDVTLQACIYLAWHLVFGVVAIAYIALRGRSGTQAGPAPRPGWIAPVALTAILSLLVLVGAAVLARHLPAFALGQPFNGGPLFYADILVLLLALAACAQMLRRPQPDYVDAAVGLTLAGFAIELTFNLLSTRPYSVGWYASRVMMFSAMNFVLVGTGMQLIATYRRASVLGDALRRESARSNERSRRMDALWTLARDPVRDEERCGRIIAEGARALAGVHGAVTGRLLAEDDLTPDDDAELVAVVRNDAGVRLWANPYPSVAVSFVVERRAYVLHFVRQDAGPGFDADDIVFVQVLSTLCGEILEQIGRRERLQYHTEREALTGLYNATIMRSRLVVAMREGDGALLTVRIANLRDIGRTLGRLAADAMVVEIAALIEGAALPGEVVARAGDDVFGIVMPSTPRDAVRPRVEAFAAAVDGSIGLGDRTGHATIDVISRLRAVIFEAGDDAEAVLTQASFEDEAGLGPERVKILDYDREHKRRYAARRDLLAELRLGIERREIGVYYQPYIDLASGDVIGAEALMRWIHPERGVMEPHAFMAMAQEWGLMPALGQSVLDRVFDDIARMRKRSPGLRVYINLDAAGFESNDLIHRLGERALRAGVPLSALGVEITETTAMRDVQAAQAVMDTLHRAGVAIALDDFGTGFSSLAYLKQYPIDTIKIDRSFVAGVPSNAFDTALIEAIVAVAAAFGMRVHAEGIETEAQAVWLRENGCASAQGYFYARPLPVEEFLAYTAMAGAGMSAGRT